MSLKDFITNKALELDEKITGGFSVVPIVHTTKDNATDIKLGLIRYFKQPTFKTRIALLENTAVQITEEIVANSDHIINDEHREELYNNILDECVNGLTAIIMHDKKNINHNRLRGQYILAASKLPLPKIDTFNPDIVYNPHYDRYTIIYKGFASYLLCMRYFI